MKYIFIKATPDYADEFYCEMFGVFTEEKFNELKTLAKKLFEGKPNTPKREWHSAEWEFYFGTNEQLIFANYDNWFSELKTQNITEASAYDIAEMFGKSKEIKKDGYFTFGTGDSCIRIDNFKERIQDQNEEQNEE